MPAQWYSGDIVTMGSRVFFCSQNEELPFLEWSPKEQRFMVLQRDNCDVPPLLASEQIDSASLGYGTVRIPCCALYGVLPLRTTSILLYVAQQEHVATLPFTETHEVFAVKRFAWMRLPSPENESSIQDGLKEDDGDQQNSFSAFPEELSEDIVAKYCALIDRFCSNSEQHSGGSLFFYSPTISLALDPSELVENPTTHYFGGSVSENTFDYEGASLSRENHVCHQSLRTFQWNSPLLRAFASLHLPDGSSFSYVPSFIRGLVAMSPAPADGVQLLLISRLSYRWAGTRYNRRGLDLAGTGTSAIFSISTLWVFSAETNEKENNAVLASSNGRKRMASYQVLRGSIPLYWSQRANLALTPEITIASPGRAAFGLRLHLKLLNELLPATSTLHCLDTTSSSEVECSLSKAFAFAVTKFRESDARHDVSFDVQYTKYDLRDKLRSKLPYDEILQGVNELLNGGVEEEAKRVDFSRWCTQPFTEDNDSDVKTDHTCSLVWRQSYQQKHYIRVNCLDCLDRTNLVQSMIVVDVLPRMIRYVRGRDHAANNNHGNNDRAAENSEKEEEAYEESIKLCKELWAQQGRALSKLYAGSDPHLLQFLVKGTLGPYVLQQTVLIATRRWFQQNFCDGDKQDIISVLTRQHDPALIQFELERRFVRPFSLLNKMMVLGLAVAIAALGVNTFILLFLARSSMFNGSLFYSLAWVLYIIILMFFIKRGGVSYTNRPMFG
ncbi:putative synaptojanin (N-terminal domain), putative,inositol/phosphatidylinositol phosphatase [Trypanosoma rangeli]|uniref:Putative synaptojanin (N-terminal domain), putative,inositol/phosphatidylinositol phosphatase n=1 Tax=Trypanosoma rangeli TaxID=5698 RepID=A0A3R7KSV3_TRYRA|nr:putative synaptojanin (N-terminal domain), putative,inositol/phosphatidylinositol phosphatase [Trypanosoma rangeli]RNF09013.1 putative synaptojanin (N-terminal domain), putative,inositol/phosphatidylinositol phosphatase [Trypanosoma rangeli]|eukprot:RNF09013.1 putative synaptojanin (N-terminal domain), putative,inositol/phosphatidylinositol phosphatase [Trypanosoma rangeli]